MNGREGTDAGKHVLPKCERELFAGVVSEEICKHF